MNLLNCTEFEWQEDSNVDARVEDTDEDDNDNLDVIVLKKLEKFSIGEDLQDALQCNVSRRMAVSSPMLLLLPMMIIEDYGQDVIFKL